MGVPVPPSIERLYLVLSPDRLTGLLTQAVNAAVEIALRDDPTFVPPCSTETIVAQAREGLSLVWTDMEPQLRALRDACASALAVRAAREAAARAAEEKAAQDAKDREVAARAAEAKAAREARMNKEREDKVKERETLAQDAAAKEARDKARKEREVAALKAKLAKLEASLASSEAA